MIDWCLPLSPPHRCWWTRRWLHLRFNYQLKYNRRSSSRHVDMTLYTLGGDNLNIYWQKKAARTADRSDFRRRRSFYGFRFKFRCLNGDQIFTKCRSLSVAKKRISPEKPLRHFITWKLLCRKFIAGKRLRGCTIVVPGINCRIKIYSNVRHPPAPPAPFIGRWFAKKWMRSPETTSYLKGSVWISQSNAWPEKHAKTFLA